MPDSAQPPQRARGARHVLYVDDEPTLRYVVPLLLEAYGYTVETAQDGAEGLRKFRSRTTEASPPYDVVITDLDMPVLDGLGLIRMLREQKQSVPIIVYSTGFSQRALDELALLRVDAVLPKGTNPADLAKIVGRVTFSLS